MSTSEVSGHDHRLQSPCENDPFWDYYSVTGDISRVSSKELIRVANWIGLEHIMRLFLQNWFLANIRPNDLPNVSISTSYHRNKWEQVFNNYNNNNNHNNQNNHNNRRSSNTNYNYRSGTFSAQVSAQALSPIGNEKPNDPTQRKLPDNDAAIVLSPNSMKKHKNSSAKPYVATTSNHNHNHSHNQSQSNMNYNGKGNINNNNTNISSDEKKSDNNNNDNNNNNNTNHHYGNSTGTHTRTNSQSQSIQTSSMISDDSRSNTNEFGFILHNQSLLNLIKQCIKQPSDHNINNYSHHNDHMNHINIGNINTPSSVNNNNHNNHNNNSGSSSSRLPHPNAFELPGLQEQQMKLIQGAEKFRIEFEKQIKTLHSRMQQTVLRGRVNLTSFEDIHIDCDARNQIGVAIFGWLDQQSFISSTLVCRSWFYCSRFTHSRSHLRVRLPNVLTSLIKGSDLRNLLLQFGNIWFVNGFMFDDEYYRKRLILASDDSIIFGGYKQDDGDNNNNKNKNMNSQTQHIRTFSISSIASSHNSRTYDRRGHHHHNHNHHNHNHHSHRRGHENGHNNKEIKRPMEDIKHELDFLFCHAPHRNGIIRPNIAPNGSYGHRGESNKFNSVFDNYGLSGGGNGNSNEINNGIGADGSMGGYSLYPGDYGSRKDFLYHQYLNNKANFMSYV